MDGKGIVFSRGGDDGRSAKSFSINILGDTNEYLATIGALLTLLSNPPLTSGDDQHGERYYVCELIRGMLPSFEQIRMIEKSQMQQ